MSTDLSTCNGQTDAEIGSGGKPAGGHFRCQRRQTHKNGKPRWRNGLGQLEHGQIVDPIHEHDSRPDTLLVIGWQQDVESFAECAFVRQNTCRFVSTCRLETMAPDPLPIIFSSGAGNRWCAGDWLQTTLLSRRAILLTRKIVLRVFSFDDRR